MSGWILGTDVYEHKRYERKSVILFVLNHLLVILLGFRLKFSDKLTLIF
jgi:hypothetical protein